MYSLETHDRTCGQAIYRSIMDLTCSWFWAFYEGFLIHRSKREHETVFIYILKTLNR